MNDRYYLVSGETLNLVETRRKYLESIKIKTPIGWRDTGATFQWEWRPIFADCTRQVLYVYEEIYDSPSSESGVAQQIYMEPRQLS